MSTKLEKLNRLRVNAGKPELKSWKASQAKLDEAIGSLEAAGFTDVLPGADPTAAPKIDDPEVAAARPEPEAPKPKKERPAIARGLEGDRQTFYGAKKSIEEDRKENGPVKPVKVEKVGLARGLDNEGFAKNCRERVRDHREAERKAAKKNKVELSEADKRFLKDEAEFRKPKKIAGQIDPKVDPEKAKRQKEKIEAKQKARAEKPAVVKDPNQVTVADIARELDIDPKVARAKMRRYEDKPNYPKPVKGERWVFPKSAAGDIRKILNGSK